MKGVMVVCYYMVYQEVFDVDMDFVVIFSYVCQQLDYLKEDMGDLIKFMIMMLGLLVNDVVVVFCVLIFLEFENLFMRFYC